MPVCPLNQRAESVMDALYQPVSGLADGSLDVETAAGANSDAAQVGAHFLAGGDDSLHQVAGLEPEVPGDGGVEPCAKPM